jgi:low affinity Fe/Cu permease
LIQNTQNRDGSAVQTKLDELIRSSDAHNAFMGIEKLTDRELEALHTECEAAAKRSEAMLERTRAEREARGESAAHKAPPVKVPATKARTTPSPRKPTARRPKAS